MKNMTIRQKMIPIYIVISIFTFLLFFLALGMMNSINAAATAEEAAGTINLFGILFPGYLVVYFVCIFAIGRTITKQVAFPAKKLVAAARQVAQGDVDVVLEHEARDEMGELTQSFREMVTSIQEQAQVLSVIAQGDYTVQLQLRGEKDVINQAIIEMLNNNNLLVSQIRTAAREVSGGANQVAQSSQTLATGSTQQAASIEELSATMAGVRQQSEDNAAAAQKALQVTETSGDKMRQGMQSMEQVAAAMSSIDESSQKITQVIKVIDDIAFQTNILALNAAVEAARAGQHGKGFAVVADEVRNLASKSAAAAKETAGLIEDSRHKVEEGNVVVEKTNEALQTVAGLATETQELVGGISQASAEQSNAFGELTAGMDQISQVVQANSATAEESAAASQEMNAQAELLDRTVARFKLREGGQQALPVGSAVAAQARQLPPSVPTTPSAGGMIF